MSTNVILPDCPADHRFERLVVVHVIDGAHLTSVVTTWPSGVVVEVRRCAECGTTVARKVARRGSVM